VEVYPPPVPRVYIFTSGTTSERLIPNPHVRHFPLTVTTDLFPFNLAGLCPSCSSLPQVLSGTINADHSVDLALRFLCGHPPLSGEFSPPFPLCLICLFSNPGYCPHFFLLARLRHLSAPIQAHCSGTARCCLRQAVPQLAQRASVFLLVMSSPVLFYPPSLVPPRGIICALSFFPSTNENIFPFSFVFVFASVNSSQLLFLTLVNSSFFCFLFGD